MSITINCDISKCKSTTGVIAHEHLLPSKWNKIQLTGTGIPYTRDKRFHICPTCSEALGMYTVKDSPDPGQELLDIIYNICKDVISDPQQSE